MKRKNYLILTGMLGIHLILLISLKFTAWPEMTLWPYLITKGWLPYQNIAIAHTPLLIFDLAIFYKIFGAGITTLRFFTWGLILLSDILVFFVARKLWSKRIAYLSLVTYAVWLLFYDGNGLWFDLYMGVLGFCSFYFSKEKRWVWAGVFWALAFLSKQTAVWFLIPIVLEMINVRQPLRVGDPIGPVTLKVRPCKVFGKFILGATVVAVPFIFLLFIFHLLPSFWNWAVNFGVFTLPGSQGQIQLPNLKTLGIATFPFLIFLPLLLSKQKNKVPYLVLAAWALAGVMGAYPRFEYFHFLPTIPYLAIAAGLVFESLRDDRKTVFRFMVYLYLLASLFLIIKFAARDFNGGTRFYENDVAEVVDYVKYSAQPGERIFVLNWWDNIYALTDTLPSTDPWVPQLSWYMKIPGIQEKIVEDIKNNPPKLVIYYPYTVAGLSSYVPEKVYDYVTENYKISQKVDGVEILVPKN